MNPIETHYDVVVVGGRPAGSTLATRLGQQGLRVLLLERAKMPSLPGASMPILYASTLALLDEIGADEAEYAAGTPKVTRIGNVTPDLDVALTLPTAYGRNYGYAVDRARFDGGLFAHAGRQPTVDARDGWSFLDVLWDEAGTRVVGVVVQDETKTRHEISADVVVGADGRFSAVARKVNAAERDEVTDNPTSLLYAYWRNVKHYDDEGATAVAYGAGNGWGYLLMDSADNTAAVGIEGRADLLEYPAGQAETFYREMLDRNPNVRARLEGAEMVTDVRGMRRVGNLYRAAGGPGWALVGDAYHQKDPLDGQGIFDAVFTAKLLALAIRDWKAGARTWTDALAWYDAQARAETYPMYRATLDRVRNSLYVEAPQWLTQIGNRTFFRWLFEDPLLQKQLGMMMTRAVRPNEVMSAPMVLGAIMRGPLHDLSKFLDGTLERIDAWERATR